MSSNLPAVHSVQFYESSEALINRLCGIVSSGLLIGNSVLIVATPKHRAELINTLTRMEVDIREHARSGRFAMYDAKDMLELFMVNGCPSRELFVRTVGKAVENCKPVATKGDIRLTVFGEMVAVLWEDGNKDGALALEKLWNELLSDGAFHLHCAYRKELVACDPRGMQSICDSHSHLWDSFAA
jgi:hypothetical protein